MTKDTYRQIGIVGAGRVAQALALGLGAHSAAPVMLWGRAPDRLRTAVGRAGRAVAAERLETLVEACDPGSIGGFSATCDSNCTAPVCGDGLVNGPAGEVCDNGMPGMSTPSCNASCTGPGA